jgi:hypothetical protein
MIICQILRTVYLPEETLSWLAELSKPSGAKVVLLFVHLKVNSISISGKEGTQTSEHAESSFREGKWT